VSNFNKAIAKMNKKRIAFTNKQSSEKKEKCRKNSGQYEKDYGIQTRRRRAMFMELCAIKTFMSTFE